MDPSSLPTPAPYSHVSGVDGHWSVPPEIFDFKITISMVNPIQNARSLNKTWISFQPQKHIAGYALLIHPLVQPQ